MAADNPAVGAFARIAATKVLVARNRNKSRRRRNLWADAAALLSKDDRSHLDFADAGAPGRILGEIESQVKAAKQKQWRFRKRNGEEVAVRDVYEKIATWVTKFKEIGDLASQVDPVHVGLPWAAVRFFLQLVVNDVERYSAMIEGVEVVSGIIARYAEIEKAELFGRSNLKTQLENGLVKLYAVVLGYLAETKKYYLSSSAGRVAKSLKSTSVKEQWLDRIAAEDDAAHRLVTLVQAENQANRLVSIRTTLINLEESVMKAKTAMVATRRRLLERLGATYTNDNYDGSLSLRQSGTANWIFEKDEFRKWKEKGQTSKLLWIHGPPGFGKTVLTASVIEHLRKEQPSTCRTAYFFCVSENEAKREPSAILTSWIAQLLEQNEGAVKAAKEVINVDDQRAITITEKWKLFRAVCSHIKGCSLVIDGFDECSSLNTTSRFHTDDARAQFLRELFDAISKTKVHVLVVSRDTAEIRTEMLRDGNANVQVSQYGITENDTKPDIWAVSRQVVDSKLQRKPEDVRTHLAEKAAEKAEGMFLWVHLLSQKLKPGINAKKLDAVVSQMPTGLEQAYERDLGLIHSLDEEEKQRAISILRWVLFAARPLTVRELVEALILNDDMDEGDSYPEDELPDDWKINFVDEDYVNEVLRQPLGSLIQLKNRDENEPLSAYTVHFVHYSVKEYLLRPNASGVSPAQEICFSDKRSENNLLARLCLQYLCYDVFGNEEVSARGVMKMYPFFRYAAHTWYRHALADNSISPDLVSCARKLLDPETFNWVLWSRTFENGEAEEQKGAESLVSSAILTAKSPMYYACLLGLLDVVKRLQTDGLDINVQGGLFGTPLQAAIVKHHSPTVQYLIDNGVDINVKAGIYSYAICGAAWTGDLEIFQLLLDRGADLEATQERNKWRPVHFSAYHPEVLKICVDRGVELEAQDSEGRTPLHWAAIHGKVECAQLLVDAGVNINAQATTSVTALLMAVQNNHYDTFVFLLSRGANPNLTDSLRQTPLYKAAVHGREKMVQALLENGAKVDSEQCDSYTPLMAASTYPGYPRIVELLLQHGADIDHRDKDGWTALHFASTLKNTETMRILLEHGAEVDPESTSLVTPLLQTGTDGSRDAFELLLQYGADISKYDIQNDTILDYALEAEKHDFVEYLLEKDVLLCSLPGLNADSTRQREQRIELSKAIFAGNADAVERILQAVLSDDLGTLLQSALHVASIAGTVELIKILLGKGASNRTVTATQRTALHYAASQGHHEFVKALLDSDANPYAQDLCRSLPLDVAIKHGLDAVETVKYLVHNYGFGPNHTPATPALINAWKNVAGAWKGTCTYTCWKKGEEEETSFEVVPWEEEATGNDNNAFREPTRFTGAGTDDISSFEIYGSLQGENQVIWAKLYRGRKLGWLYSGTFDPTSSKITGHWGTNESLWHGEFSIMASSPSQKGGLEVDLSAK